MSDESQLQLTRKDGNSSLAVSKVRFGLIVRGRRDAEILAVLARTESELAPEPEVERIHHLYFSGDGRSVEAVRQDAERGDAKSQYLVADKPGLYNVDSLTWLRKAAEQGYARALFKLGARCDGDLFAKLKGEPQDAVQAVHWYRKAAEQRLNEAAFNLGSMYAHGEGVPQDYAESVQWYRKAADGGLQEAQYNLGLVYNNGDGLPQDYAEAAKWYRKAAEQGMQEGCFNLGVLYETGRGVPQDHTEAARWYLNAAEGSYNCKAEFNIGLKFEKGQGVAQDDLEAYKWLHFAVDDARDSDRKAKYAAVRDRVSAKLTPAQIVEALRLAEEYSIANRDVAEGTYDYAEAEKLYRRAAEQGNASAQCQLGYIYSRIRDDWFPGLPPDYAEAAKWYRKAAEQGHASAQFNLGGACYNGQGVTQDYTEAAKWWRQAADQGNATAQFNLGCSYTNGEGVPQDDVLAHMYYNLAASHDNGKDLERRARARDDVAKKLTAQQLAEAQRMAREWRPK